MFKKGFKKIIVAMLVMVLAFSVPMSVNAQARTNIGQLMDYALDDAHPVIAIGATTDNYPQEYMNTVGAWAMNAFNSWAFDNLKYPQGAVVNEIDAAVFSYQLAYPDMNTSYTGYINDLMISGIKPETIQSIGYVVRIDYSAQNGFGGYVRNTIYGIITADGTSYNFGDVSLGKNLPTLSYYSLFYSGNPIMKWR